MDAKATVQFNYAQKDTRGTTPDAIFNGLSKVRGNAATGGLLYGLGKNRRALGVAAPDGYYELNEKMELQKKDDEATLSFIRGKFAIPKQAVTVEKSSVLIVDDNGRRWRLPLGNKKFTELTGQGVLRICREVATERDLLNCHGTFYELPAENADGYAKIRPVASHNFRINDYASYRGLLIFTGIDAGVKNPRIIRSADGKAAVWAGVIDDLWKMGKPTGTGGPWSAPAIKPGEPSDPYLIGFYDQRDLALSHNGGRPVTFTIEMDPVGNGVWMKYKEVTVKPSETFRHHFPDGIQARWIRFTGNGNCEATAMLTYK